MRLRDKIADACYTYKNGQLRGLEKIADDYAIEFAEWCIKNRRVLHTTEGLLQIFKKEKGL